jgi:acetyl-CoA carboxylase biotin carboxyl carrier protein
MKVEKKTSSWLERVEEIITVLEGSSISELELTEQGTEIIIRRQPSMMMVNVPTQLVVANGNGAPAGMGKKAAHVDQSVAIVAPLTGVYYSAESPASSPFVNIGDVIQVGQIVALIEAMKVFNEVAVQTSGRVTTLVATNGNVVQKGDVLLRIEPL